MRISQGEDSLSLPEADSVFSFHLARCKKCSSSSFLLSIFITFSLSSALSFMSCFISSVRFCASLCLCITVLAISERHILEISPVAMPIAFKISLVLNWVISLKSSSSKYFAGSSPHRFRSIYPTLFSIRFWHITETLSSSNSSKKLFSLILYISEI